MAFSREKSTVRFDRYINYIGSEIRSGDTRTSTKCLGTRTSSLSLNNHRAHRLTHKYIPRLHRQATEIPETTPLGSALKQFTQTCLHDELSISEKSSALDELKFIMNSVVKAITRNRMGLQFSSPVYTLGFSHWQSQAEKRVVCYLPVRLPRVEIHPISSHKVLLQLPRRFPYGMNVEPKDLEGFHSGYHKYTSSKKLYSLIIKILKRILVMKSVEPNSIHFSSSPCLMEIMLQENAGWIGEIVPCIVSGNSDSIFYSCKPFYEQSVPSSPIQENTQKDSLTSQESDGRYSQPTIIESLRRDSQNTLGSIFLPGESTDFDGNNSNSPIGSVHLEYSRDKRMCLSYADSNNPGVEIEANESRITDHRSKSSKTNDSTSFMENLSDIHWYPCNPHSENKVFEVVSKTDGGMRTNAMMIVCKLSQHDWRLVSLRCYDVQTAMLHDVESRLDHCPRWQRDTLQQCVRSLLSKLHKFARQVNTMKGLPHFSVDSLNLWSHWDQKQMQLAESALERLISSDTSLVSLLCRAGGISMEDLT